MYYERRTITRVSGADDAVSKPSVYVGVDTETAMSTEDCAAPPLACLTVYEPGEDEARIYARVDAPFIFADLMHRALTKRFTIVANHLPYDLSIMMNEAPELTPMIFRVLDEGLFECTLLCEKLDDIARGAYDNKGKGRWHDLGDGRKFYTYALDESVKIRLGMTLAKDESTGRGEFGRYVGCHIEQIPPHMVAYAKLDAKAHWLLREAQETTERQDPAGTGYYVYSDAPAQTRAGFALALMRIKGIRTDPVHTARLKDELQARMLLVVDDLIKIGFLRHGRVRPRAGDWVPPSKDTKKIKAHIVAVAAAQGVEYKRTKSDDVSMDAEAIEMLDDASLGKLREYVKTEKLIGYTTILQTGFKHAIHSEPNTLVSNGRISWGSDAPDGASAAKSVNLTNLPTEPGVRECYIPCPGNMFFDLDYSTLELCTVAQCCLWWLKYSRLSELLNAGIDLHSMLGSMILSISYDEFLRRYAAGDKLCEAVRQLAKRANFGLWGGMGIDRFFSTCRDLVEDLREAGIVLSREFIVFLKETWLSMLPEARDYFKIAAHVEETTGQIVQFVSRRIRGGLQYTDAANTPFSGLAADGAKEAMYKIQRACYAEPESPLFGSWLVVFEHDAFFGESPEDRAHDAIHEAERIAVDTMQTYVPDVRIKMSKALIRRNRKAAKAYYVDAASNPCGHKNAPACGCRMRPWEESPRFKELLAKGEVFL